MSATVAPTSAAITSAAGATGALRCAMPGRNVSSKSSTWPAAPSAATGSPAAWAAQAAGSARPPSAHARQSRTATRYDTHLMIVHSREPLNAETPRERLLPAITPTGDFYVRNHGPGPAAPPSLGGR